MPARFIGLDGEMTGLGGPDVHQLIQIGVAISPQEVLARDVGYDDWNEDAEAMRVNGFTAKRIRTAPRASDVDREVVSWLGPRASGDPEGLIAVGWDVAAVDSPYVSRYLPRLAGLLSRQTVDLNAVCFTIAGDASSRYKTLRKKAEGYAEQELGRADWHDAGFDAAAAIAAWDFLKKLVRGDQT